MEHVKEKVRIRLALASREASALDCLSGAVRSAIHPFFMETGRRQGRYFYFKAMRNDLSYVELLSVSTYLKEHGRQYETSFEKVVANDAASMSRCPQQLHYAVASFLPLKQDRGSKFLGVV